MSEINVNIIYTGRDIEAFNTSNFMDTRRREAFQDKLKAKFNTVSGILAQHGFKVGDIVDHAKKMRGNMDEANMDALSRDLKPLDFSVEKHKPFDMSVMLD